MPLDQRSISPKENGLCIPTICLDSNADAVACSRSQATHYDPFMHTPDDHSSGFNVFQIFSCMPSLSSDKKFLMATVLLKSCEVGYHRAHTRLYETLHQTQEELIGDLFTKANDIDHIISLQPLLASEPMGIIDRLLKLLPHFSFLSSTANTIDHIGWPTDGHGAALNSNSSSSYIQCTTVAEACCNSQTSELACIERSSDQECINLKYQYLNLIAECAWHLCCAPDPFMTNGSGLDALAHPLTDAGMKETLLQHPFGQLLIVLFLHPAIGHLERLWLIRVIQTYRKPVSVDSHSGKESCSSSSEGCDELYEQSRDSVTNKWLDCISEVCTDMSAILHAFSVGPENCPSLTHSITSSGFLSSDGGAGGSQYDLLSETANSNSSTNANHAQTGSHYGTLLTVPNSDSRSNTFNNSNNGQLTHGLNPHQPIVSSGSLREYRRSSDGPDLSHYAPYMHATPNLQESSLSHQLDTTTTRLSLSYPRETDSTSMGHAPGQFAFNSAECVLCRPTLPKQQLQASSSFNRQQPQQLAHCELAPGTLPPPPLPQPPTSRASLPDAFGSTYVVGRMMAERHPAAVSGTDSVSQSSASSTFSSHLELIGLGTHQNPHASVNLTTSVSSNTNRKERSPTSSSSSHPSPPPNIASTNMVALTDNPNFVFRPEDELSLEMYPSTFSKDNCHSEGSSQMTHEVLKADSQLTIEPSVSSQSVEGIVLGHYSDGSISYRSYCSFFDPMSGMTAVPGWLKSLRLHKYASLFQQLSYEQFMNITDSWLEEREVTRGARTKLLLSIQKLSMRKCVLAQAELGLVQAPSIGPAALTAVDTCLTEVWHIMQTPIKPPWSVVCETINTTAAACPWSSADTSTRDAPLCGTQLFHKHSDSPVPYPETNNSFTPNFGDAHGRLSAPESVCRLIDMNESYNLPDLIMSCLTKVCSRLLVSWQPDVDSCDRFVQIVGMILEHPAFLVKQKNLAASWKQRISLVRESMVHPSEPEGMRTYRSMPRSYYHHPPHHPPSQQLTKMARKNIPVIAAGSRTSRLLPKDHITLPLSLVNQTHQNVQKQLQTTAIPYAQLQRSLQQRQDEILHNSQLMFTSHEGLGNTMQPDSQTKTSDATVYPLHDLCASTQRAAPSDNGSRRHSVPVNQFPGGPILTISGQGRRMPSPHPACLPFRGSPVLLKGGDTVNQGGQQKLLFPHSVLASSDADVSNIPLAAHLAVNSRFPSPSFPGSYRRTLLPPATAPPTRMPSPSDRGRQGYSNYHPTWSAALSCTPLNQSTSLIQPCSSSTSQLAAMNQLATSSTEPNQSSGSVFHIQPNVPDLSMLAHAPLGVSTGPFESTFCTIIPSPKCFSDRDTVRASGTLCESSTHPRQRIETQNYYQPSQPNTFDDSESISDLIPQELASMCCIRTGNLDREFNQSSIGDASTQLWPGTYVTPQSNHSPVNSQRATAQGSLRKSTNFSNASAGTECIERDLDMLTREVTELAIGEFDSPGAE